MKFRNKFKNLKRRGKTFTKNKFTQLKNNGRVKTFTGRTKRALKKTGRALSNIANKHGDTFLEIGSRVGENLLSRGIDKLLGSTNNAGNAIANKATAFEQRYFPSYPIGGYDNPNLFNYPPPYYNQPMYGSGLSSGKRRYKNRKRR